MSHIALIPNHEEELYAALPARVRVELDQILQHLPFILEARSTLQACREVAGRIGLKANQLYNRICQYLKTRDWKKLVNKARAGARFWETNALVGVPVSFQKFYQGLCERNQRTDRGGYHELMLIWRTHLDSAGTFYDRIPGYAQWPVAGRKGHPEGWSPRNLHRFAPDEYDSAASRVGPFAASQFRPPVLTTRVGLRFCERVEFDDHEYNLKVHFPGQDRAMRPRGFNAVEALSAFITPTFKPTLWDGDEEKKKVLTERDMMWFAIYWLTRIGYRTDERGTWFVTELGTAAIKQAFAERILRATHDKVRIAEPGMFGRPAHKGQFAGRGKGNFKHKALVEGSFSLVDNYFATLPGQVGLNRLVAPEEMHGREAYFKGLLKEAERLPLDRADKLRIPFLAWAQFMHRAQGIYEAINGNHDHALEGWTDLGFHALEFRLTPQMPWQSQSSLLQLPARQREAIESLVSIESEFPLTRARNLSRKEAFESELQRNHDAGTMKRVSPWRYCELMGIEHGYEVTVGKNSLFSIDSRDFGLKPLQYLAAINGNHFRPGEKFLAFINPWDPGVMLLCRGDGAAVGLCQLWDKPCKNDEENLLRMVGQQGHWLAEREAGANARHADQAREIEHLREHNELVRSGGAVTAQEKLTARNVKNFDGEISDLAREDARSTTEETDEQFSAEGLL